MIWIIPIVLFLVAVRTHWVLWKVKEHTLKVLWYCVQTKQSQETKALLAETWPISFMLVDYRWSFRRYVSYRDLYDEMETFIATELKKPNLNIDLSSFDQSN